MIPTPEQAYALVCDYNEGEFHRKHARIVGDVMRWYANELTGLIGACAIMLPSKSVQDLEVKSLKKKFKNKKFAAGCSRDVITSGAELLDWDLDTLFERTLAAMKASGNVD